MRTSVPGHGGPLVMLLTFTLAFIAPTSLRLRRSIRQDGKVIE